MGLPSVMINHPSGVCSHIDGYAFGMEECSRKSKGFGSLIGNIP